MNTVIEPWVDVSKDIRAINSGMAIRTGNVFDINGRRYGIEGESRLYPIDGPGFHQIDRQTYKAIGAYNTYGYTADAKRFIVYAGISRQQHATALRIWRRGRRGRA